LTLVVVGGSYDDIRRFNLNNVVAHEIVLLTNARAQFGGYGAVGNHYLEHGRGDVLGLIHADTVLSPKVSRELVVSALMGCVAGIVGKTLDGRYVWSKDVAPETVEYVSTLDSCSMFVRRSAGIHFDTKTFDSFHCCVEDFCLQAAIVGRPIVVPSGPAGHVGDRWKQRNTPEGRDWLDKYADYREKLTRKWHGVDFQTT
jgi:hypothetical protein